MTPEENQKELLGRFREFGEGLREANTIVEEQEKARLKRNINKRKENVWYGFATAIVSGNFPVHFNDIPNCADTLTDEFMRRFPNESN